MRKGKQVSQNEETFPKYFKIMFGEEHTQRVEDLQSGNCFEYEMNKPHIKNQ
jgi:hypothetical protein